jgi:hypothetical protein
LPYVALNLNQARLPAPPTFARFTTFRWWV